MRSFILFICLSLLVFSCNSDKDSTALPKATGKSGDMIIIMDSLQWKTPLGQEVRKIFLAELPGLPRSEPAFNVTFVHPNKKIRLLTQVRNLVYVFTLDQQTAGSKILREDFSETTLAKIKNDTSFFLSTEKDEYSRGQQVMYLFGDTNENLTHHLQLNRNRLREFFNTFERQRAIDNLAKTKSTEGLANLLRQEQQIEMAVPFGYKLADKSEDFVWLRQIETEEDNNIFIVWKAYESEYQLLPDSLLDWRNSILRKYIFEDPENPDSYLTTETKIPFNPLQARQVTIDGSFAMELRGLWKTNNNTMGGPFLSYARVDEKKGRIYYIEGFTFSPGREQREILRKLEASLWTFKFVNR